MKLGVVLSAPTIADQIRIAQSAEDAGFDSVWTIEFFNQHGFVRLAAVASATRRVRVGTAIAYAFMRTPVLAATGAMDIDEISGGRMVLGLGSGTRNMNEKWYSVPFKTPPAPRMREAVALIRATFEASGGGGLAFEGEHYTVSNPTFQRAGAVRETIPIYIAAVNRGMIRAAAAVGDGLVGHPVYTRRYIREAVNPELDGTRCELAPYVICSIADDREVARREARAQVAFYYSTRLYHTILDVHGWRETGEEIAAAFRRLDFAAMSEAVSDELLDEIAVTGTPDEARDRLANWEGLTDQVLLYPPTVGTRPERVRENLEAIVDTFGRR